jgi:hypothetical protein
MKLLLPLPLKNIELMMPAIRAEGGKVTLELRYARTYDKGHLPIIIQADLEEAVCVHQALGEAIETARKVRRRAPKKVEKSAGPTVQLLPGDEINRGRRARKKDAAPSVTTTKRPKAVVPTNVTAAKKGAQRAR